uniref:Uncharacterized protein n=1 Tax=Strigamia maritima TaxID=126957 RepID=T1J8Z3_STRMM
MWSSIYIIDPNMEVNSSGGVLNSTMLVEESLAKWEAGLRDNSDPLPILTSIAELVEKETEAYLKMDPDPFDDRHPGRSDPQCSLGHLLKAIFNNDDFMTKLINNYALDRESREINTAACRLLLDLLPGLETSVIFQETENLVSKLFHWAETAPEPLRSYSTGLLGAAMEIPDVATKFQTQNADLVPKMWERLREFRKYENKEQSVNGIHHLPNSCIEKVKFEATDDACDAMSDVKVKRLSSPKSVNGFNENSNSNWTEMEQLVIGSFKMCPLDDSMKQRLILQFLTSTGECQEFKVKILKKDDKNENVLDLLFRLIDLKVHNDVGTAFEALKYLATILCHKKVAIEFLAAKGLEKLLAIHRPSIAATGVSMCLYYLAHNEDAMERVCLLSDSILSRFVNYALWLLECSHDSGRCHATMFFGLCLRYQRILDLFDDQDGLRKLFNLISTLEILSIDGYGDFFNDDKVFASRQTVRHVCLTLKRYYEAHLLKKAQEINRLEGNSYPMLRSKASKLSLEVIQEILEIVTLIPFVGQSWKPVDELHKLAGITLLLRAIALIFTWNFSAKAEIARNALDVLTVCSMTYKTQSTLRKPVPLPNPDTVRGESSRIGMAILLDAAEGKVIMDADVQRKALNVVINCVSEFVPRMNGLARPQNSATRRSGKKKLPRIDLVNKNRKFGDDLVNKGRKCVQDHNGIQVLLSLITVKTPITDADSIRALACKALLGLVHYESVKQIISKLPLFISGELNVLKNEPILQDKHSEHVKFCKYTMQLMEKVTGIPLDNGIESSINKIHLADVVAQTKYNYKDIDLVKLIYQCLLRSGFVQSASTLWSEARLQEVQKRENKNKKMPQITPNFSPASCTTPLRPIKNRSAVIRTPHRTPGVVRSSMLEKSQSGGYSQSPIMRLDEKNSKNAVTLENIVTEYLRKQHALCHHPVVTCPPFGLLEPHSCPTPLFRRRAPANFSSRVQCRPVFPQFGGDEGSKMDRKLIYSRFCPVKVFKNGDEGDRFTSVTFMSCDQKIAFGTDSGELKLYNLYSGQEEQSFECHESPLTHLELSRFHYVEFSRLNQDRIVGTKGETAAIFDLRTGKRVSVLAEPAQSNNYVKNQATFNPTDELVLSDGVLWDVRSSKFVHKFDKFNANISGIFHPNGLEILSNSEIWDLRTHKLLHTVPTLDQCQVKFNHLGNVIYAAMLTSEDELELDLDHKKSPFGSSFQTLDPSDYSNIATIDIKKNIYDFCSDKSERFLAVIEHQADYNACRLYEVGRRRNEEEIEEEEEEEVESEEGSGSDMGTDDEDYEMELLAGDGHSSDDDYVTIDGSDDDSDGVELIDDDEVDTEDSD